VTSTIPASTNGNGADQAKFAESVLRKTTVIVAKSPGAIPDDKAPNILPTRDRKGRVAQHDCHIVPSDFALSCLKPSPLYDFHCLISNVVDAIQRITENTFGGD
jgi:hypothetical protein